MAGDHPAAELLHEAGDAGEAGRIGGIDLTGQFGLEGSGIAWKAVTLVEGSAQFADGP
ncbi:hypothetical protein [Streptomyces sp. NPDC127039]|uniref:hypothetical protein n=1 Tax=Streptomyces sp. NPDC127039 TaxID=3347115 RepID=UPI0036620273